MKKKTIFQNVAFPSDPLSFQHQLFVSLVCSSLSNIHLSIYLFKKVKVKMMSTEMQSEGNQTADELKL